MKHSKQFIFESGLVLILWMGAIFNPPPLAGMSQRQKMKRILLVALTLFLFCLGAATLGAIGLAAVGRARELMREQTAIPGAEIMLAGILGNALCWRTLLAIRRS